MRDGRSDSRPVDWGLRGPTGLGLGLARVREIGARVVPKRRRCLRFILIFGVWFRIQWFRFGIELIMNW